MLLVCPSCSASYEVQAAALGAAGRSVRCHKCLTVWHASPVVEAAEAAAAAAMPAADGSVASDEAVAAFRAELAADDEPAPAGIDEGPVAEWGAPVDEEVAAAAEGQDPAQAPAGEVAAPDGDAPAEAPAAPEGDAVAAAADDATPPADAAAPAVSDIPPADAPPLAPEQAEGTLPPDGPLPPEPEDIESVAARRARLQARRRRRLRPGLPMLILVLIGVIAALIGWRGDVVRHAPQMASLYSSIGLPVNLRGLVFADLKTTREAHDGVNVMVVEGMIVNATAVPIEVPRLRFAVRNEFGNEIYAWTAQPSQTVLPAGEKLPFRSRLASPPTESRAIAVRFFTRRDALAGVR
jgi:predicted Zn finger-like uncharacterized protein